jgi:hypothetical protein
MTFHCAQVYNATIPGSWTCSMFRILEGVPGLDDFDAELTYELVFAGRITLRHRARSVP